MSMKKSLVSDWMTPEPVSIPMSMNLPKAHQLMKDHSIRRLPVVEDGKLIGIVTLGDVREAGPSGATSLSIYELNYLLANLTVGDIMTRDPITLEAKDSLHDAAEIMLSKKIGGLPIVDEENHLIGIITESDVFRAIMEIFPE